ncbi:MAG TPA: hypothetical protein DHV31_03480 [Clostridiales bacterium]|nr:hypothetical protein [Clostridiales bacterium]
MFKNPFVVLGLDKNATQAEVQEAYERLREEYRAAIHNEGDEGKKAAKKLSELETAYREAMDILSGGSEIKGVYTVVADHLKSRNFDAAQAALDQVSERDAEWHYYQSAVYHGKGWNYEAKAQLDMAINMDPDNQKYKDTLDRMKNHEQGGGERASAERQRSYDTYENMQQNGRGASASDCCASLICADCCCECMGGDLIRCC